MKPDEKAFLLALYSNSVTPRKLINDRTVAINHKRAKYLLGKWCEKDWYDYGVTLDLGWLTSKGVSKAKEVLGGEQSNDCRLI